MEKRLARCARFDCCSLPARGAINHSPMTKCMSLIVNELMSTIISLLIGNGDFMPKKGNYVSFFLVCFLELKEGLRLVISNERRT